MSARFGVKSGAVDVIEDSDFADEICVRQRTERIEDGETLEDEKSGNGWNDFVSEDSDIDDIGHG